MISVNAQFHSLITDESVPQILLLCESTKSGVLTGGYYLSSDGDISSDGASFVDEMTSGEDYVCGCVSSRAMSVSLMNVDGSLNGHNFGWLRAYIGVYESTSSQTLAPGVNAQITIGAVTYYAKSDGFYAGSTLIFSGNCTGLFGYSAYEGYVYFFLTNSYGVSAYAYKIGVGVESADISQRDCEKYSSGKSVLVDSQNLYMTNADGDVEHYYIACVGNFRVDKPQNTMTQEIHIQDAFDLVRELDVDATSYLTDLKNSDTPPTSCLNLLQRLLSACGITLVPSDETQRLTYFSSRLDVLLAYSYTVRQIVGYACEMAGCNARLVPGSATIMLYYPNGETGAEDYPIIAERIEAQSVAVQEYKTPHIDSYFISATTNDFWPSSLSKICPPGGGNYTYKIVGNPFDVRTFRVRPDSLALLQNIPTFYPMEFSVINADPSFQTGDMIAVGFYTENALLTTYGGEEITDHDGNEITVNPPLGMNLPVGMQYIPIMGQTLKFNGRCYATYSATGTSNRSGDDTSYESANARTSNTIYTGETAEDVLASTVALSASTTTGTALCSVTLSAGLWMLYGYVQFSAVSGGARRVVCVSSTSGSINGTIRNDSQVTSNLVTTHSVAGSVYLSSDSTFYLNACSSVACNANATNTLLQAVRLM